MKKEPTKQDYNEFVEEITPTANIWTRCLGASLVGGTICTIAQIIKNLILHFTAVRPYG